MMKEQTTGPGQVESVEFARDSAILAALQSTLAAGNQYYNAGEFVLSLHCRVQQEQLALELAKSESQYFALRGRGWLAGAYAGKGMCLGALGHYRDAFKWFAKSDALRSRLRLGDYPTTTLRHRQADALRHWAGYQRRDRKTSNAKAEKTLQRSYELFKECHKQGQITSPWYFVTAAVDYGDVLLSRGKYERASEVCSHALQLLRDLPKEHRKKLAPNTAKKLTQLSRRLRKRPGNPEAPRPKQRLRRSQEILSSFYAIAWGMPVFALPLWTSTAWAVPMYLVLVANLLIYGLHARRGYLPSVVFWGVTMAQMAAVVTVPSSVIALITFASAAPAYLWLRESFFSTSVGRTYQTAILISRERAELFVDRLAERLADITISSAWTQKIFLVPGERRFRPVFRIPLTSVLATSHFSAQPLLFLSDQAQVSSWSCQTVQLIPSIARLQRLRSKLPRASIRRWAPSLARRFTLSDPLPA